MATTPSHNSRGGFSNSGAAAAETYYLSDGNLNTVQYFDVLSQDHAGNQASLWSIGTTDLGPDDWTVQGGTSGPTELLAQDTAYGVDDGTYQSALGAGIFITSAGEVGYDMAMMSAPTRLKIDDLAVGQSLTDSFYYAIELGGGMLSWNEVSVVIDGAAAQIAVTDGQVVENRGVDGSGNLTDTEAISVAAASGDATSFTIAPASSDTIGTVTPDGATLNPDGSYTLAGGSGTYTYSVSNDAVLATHLGYGESQQEWFTLTTANGTTLSFAETVHGDINAPVVTATAAQTSIVQGGTVQLEISATDNDDNATLAYTITGAPAGAALSSAADPGGVSFDPAAQRRSVAAAALGDLTLTPGSGFAGDIRLSVTVTNTEVNPSDPSDVATAATTAAIDITVEPAASGYFLDVPGAYNTYVAATNGTGQLAGYYQDSTGQHAFLYSAGGFTTPDPVTDGYGIQATAINNNGDVLGFYGDSTGVHGFLHDSAGYTVLDASASGFYGYFYTYANAINDSGERLPEITWTVTASTGFFMTAVNIF